MISNFYEKLKRLIYKDQALSSSDVAKLCKTNERDAYEIFWGNEDLIKAYLEPSRIESYMFVIQYVLSKKYGNRVVEIGFGSGDFLRLLTLNSPERHFEIYGLDYSKMAVKRATGILPEGNFSTGNVYNLPYANDFFDQVFCIQTLEHLRNPEQVLKEMDRVCSPNGMILISVPNGELDSYEGHVNFWSESEFRKFLSPRELIDFKIYNQDRVFMVSMKPLKG
jgi:2-polyprenyl-3-methyl-5-hydroxy-6-metoxy-1,4-benzoquinol methylase